MARPVITKLSSRYARALAAAGTPAAAPALAQAQTRSETIGGVSSDTLLYGGLALAVVVGAVLFAKRKKSRR